MNNTINTIYVDNAATTKMSEQVVLDMIPYFNEYYGNPSSLYTLGQMAKTAITAARTPLAKLIGAQSGEIVFTGSGTEADNMALKGILYSPVMKKKGKNHLITTKIEHPAVLESAKHLEKQGFCVTYLNCDEYGFPDLEQLKNSITDKTALISVMAANNEIGTIMPLMEIGKIAKEHNVLFHTDAVQAIGHTPLDVETMNISLLSMSAHKIHGPKGVGALYVKKGVFLENVIDGGGQEKNRRSGTENVAGIIGFASAASLMVANSERDNEQVRKLSDKLTHGVLKMEKTHQTGHPEKRLPGTCSFAIEAIEGESLILMLNAKGICASTGSACSTGSLDPSHVLMGIGLTHERAHGSLRMSLSKYTTESEIDYILAELPGIVAKLRAMSPVWNA